MCFHIHGVMYFLSSRFYEVFFVQSHKMKYAPIPMKIIGPVHVVGQEIDEKVMIPMATYETPLWYSVRRGTRVVTSSGGTHVTLIDERMSRSILLEATDAQKACCIWQDIRQRKDEMNQVIAQKSRFARLIDLHVQIVGHLLYLRFDFVTGDAAGHNMVTLAAEHLQRWLQKQHPTLQYGAISANYCCDKKISAVNGVLGRGKHVVAEVLIPRGVCERLLRVTPEAIVDLNIKKNFIGSVLAGGVRSANAHFANMLLAFYLATGQDGANIVEGSQGITYAAIKGRDLYFSVTLPNSYCWYCR